MSAALGDYQHATLYDLLEIPRDASDDQVKDSYRLQSKVWHPDRFRGESRAFIALVQKRQQAINDAYKKLSSLRERAKYDRGLAPAPEELQVFPLPEQNRPEVWKRMSRWMKDEDVGQPFNRQMAFRAGDLLERSRRPSEKQIPYMLEAWEMAVADGFDPAQDDGDE